MIYLYITYNWLNFFKPKILVSHILELVYDELDNKLSVEDVDKHDIFQHMQRSILDI